MRRLARHLFALCSAVSLLIGAAWARSYRASDKFAFVARPEAEVVDSITVGTVRGGLEVNRFRIDVGDLAPRAPTGPHLRFGQPPLAAYLRSSHPRVLLDVLGLRAWQGTRTGKTAIWSVRIPFWLPTLLTSALAWRLGVAARREKLLAARQKARLCTSCGYDLRASPDRCPECGAEAAANSGRTEASY